MWAQSQTQWAQPQAQWSQPQSQWTQPQQGLGQSQTASQQKSFNNNGGGGWNQSNNGGGGWNQAQQSSQQWQQQSAQQSTQQWQQPAQQSTQQWQQPAQQSTQQWQQPQQQAPQAQTASSKDVMLEVSGCSHATVGPIVRGTFNLLGENHGKPTYKRQGQVNGLDVMMYYWDQRDGAAFNGWWFGPKVGGDQVWAYHSDSNAGIPPTNGWKVPYDGVIDNTLTITVKPKASAGYSQPQASWSQGGTQQQSWQQPQQQQSWQQSQQQQSWQQQATQNDAQQRFEQQKLRMEEMRKQQQLESEKRQLEMRQQQLQQAQQAEAQRQLQAARKAQQMEAMKLQQMELQRKRVEEQKRKEEEAARKKVEQVAVLAIRKVMQKYKSVGPDKHDEAKAELDKIAAENLPGCGSQQARIRNEIEQAVIATKEKIEKIAELKRKHEVDREAELVRRRVLKKEALVKIAQLEELVVNAENVGKAIVSAAEPFADDREMTPEELDSYLAVFDDATKEATAAAQSAGDFVAKEGPSIKSVPPIPEDPAPSVATEFANLMHRYTEMKKTMTRCTEKVSHQKNIRVQKAEGQRKTEKIMQTFKKYDLDKDDKLSKKEILAYAKGEHGFALDTSTLDSICRFLIKAGEKGISKENFGRLKIMVGVQREMIIDAKKKVAREIREEEIKEAREAAQEKAKACGELVGTFTERVAAVEKEVNSLKERMKTLNAAEMISKADDIDKLLEETRKQDPPVTEAIDELKAESVPEVKIALATDIVKYTNLVKSLGLRLDKCSKASAKFRSDAASRTQEELEKLSVVALAMLSYHRTQKKLSSEALFEAFTSKDCIGETDFVKFFKNCEKKEGVEDISEDDLEKLFKYFAGGEEESISKDMLCTLTRKFMRVAKASVLSDDISIKASKPGRRLEEGEIVEVIMGPIQEGSMEVMRTKVKALKDDVEGWVTPVGNQGTVFLEEGGNVKVLKETLLTASFSIGEDSKDKGKERKLKVGDICEVREWEKKEPGSGLMRMKVRCKSNGQIGWVTSVGNTGIKFVEPV